MITWTVTETVSGLVKETSLNKFSVLEIDPTDPTDSLKNTERKGASQNLKALMTVPSHKSHTPAGEPLGMPEEAEGVAQTSPGLESADQQLISLMGEDCITTGKTISAIFGRLQYITNQLDFLQKSLNRKEEKPQVSKMRPPYLIQEQKEGSS